VCYTGTVKRRSDCWVVQANKRPQSERRCWDFPSVDRRMWLCHYKLPPALSGRKLGLEEAPWQRRRGGGTQAPRLPPDALSRRTGERLRVSPPPTGRSGGGRLRGLKPAVPSPQFSPSAGDTQLEQGLPASCTSGRLKGTATSGGAAAVPLAVLPQPLAPKGSRSTTNKSRAWRRGLPSSRRGGVEGKLWVPLPLPGDATESRPSLEGVGCVWKTPISSLIGWLSS
jgi:hypothetical protein